MIRTISAFSFATIAPGVPFGMKNAAQFAASNPANPCSCADGRFGRLDERSLVRIASALICPPSISGIAIGVSMQR